LYFQKRRQYSNWPGWPVRTSLPYTDHTDFQKF